jgi:hypothetical protein
MKAYLFLVEKAVLLFCISIIALGAADGTYVYELREVAAITGRRMAPAVTLLDGRVLLIGGNLSAYGNADITGSCILYNPTDNTVSSAANLIKPRGSFTDAVRLNNGNVLIIGGIDNTQNYTATGEIYNVSNNSWSSIAGNPFNQAGPVELTLLPDGQVLVFGSGLNPIICTKYNPATNTWSRMADLPVQVNGGISRRRNEYARIINNKLYFHYEYWYPNQYNFLAIYDISTNVWTTGAMNGALINCGLYPLANGNATAIIYNDNGTNNALPAIYDVMAGSWNSYLTTGLDRPSIQINDGIVIFGYGSGLLMDIDGSNQKPISYPHNINPCLTATVASIDGTTCFQFGDANFSYNYIRRLYKTLKNSAPSFSKGNDVIIGEDSGIVTINNWATEIAKGNAPIDEASQVITFFVSNDNNSLFSAQPAITSAGTLSFTPASNAFGSATISVYLKDDGGTLVGGSDTSATRTFTITVLSTNDTPAFSIPASVTVLEDSGPFSQPGFATGISAGPANESSQTVNFTLSNDQPTLFSSQPAISPAGVLTFTPSPNAFGTATITSTLTDTGGTANGGINFLTKTFTINITSVNDAPSFTISDPIRVNQDGGAQNTPNWAKNISAGPLESGAVTFTVTNNHNELFSVQPAIDSSGNLSFTIAANITGSATLAVIAHDTGGTDNGGIDTSASQQQTITISTVPRATIAPNSGSTNSNPIVFTISFTEAVIGLLDSELQVTNGSIANLSGSGASFTAQVTPSGDGAVTLTLPPDVCASPTTGIGNLSATASVISDRTRPVLAITPDAISSNAASITFSFNFSESVFGFTSGDVVVNNGSKGVFLGSGGAYTLVVTPSSDGQVTVTVPLDSCADVAGNGNLAVAATIVSDRTSPIVAIAPSGGITNAIPIPFVFTFSEPVSGFAIDDITVTNGTKETFSGSGTTYTLLVNPSNEGTVSVNVGAGACSDADGNLSIAGSASTTWDHSSPSCLITPNGTSTNSTSLTATFTFSEVVYGFTISDIAVTNANKGAFSGSGSVYTLQLSPIAQGPVVISINAGVCQDAAANNNTAASVSVIFDTVIPTMTITPDGTVTNAASVTFSFTASETIQGFTSGDISVTNGSKGLFTGSGGTYNLVVTPSGDGQVAVSIGAGSFTDAAGNGNESVAAAIISDRTRPTVAITPNSGSTNLNPISFTFTFSEVVTGLTIGDISLTNGTAGVFAGSGDTYTLQVSPVAEGPVTAEIGNNCCVDGANNGVFAGSATITYDLVAPTLTITPSSQHINSSTVSYTFTFSKTVVGFTSSDITVVNGTKGVFAGSGSLYTLGVTPTIEGNVTVSVPAGACIDASANPNTPASSTCIFDQTSPTFTIAPNAVSTNASPIVFTITASEAVTGFNDSDISITNGTKGLFTQNGQIYTLVVTPSSDGAVVLTIDAARCVDLAGNPNLIASASITSDRTSPTVAIAPTGTSTNANPISFTFTFSEPVTGLTVDDVIVTNGIKGVLAGGGTTYSLPVTPSGDGDVTVSIPASSAVDAVGNGNRAAASTVTSIRTAPTCDITFPAAQANNANITVTFAFSSPVIGFTAGDITVANANKGSFSGSGSNYSLTLQAQGEGTVTVSIASGVCTDQVGNGNSASTGSIIYDATPPTLTISPAGTVTNASPILMTLTWDEPVFGFTSSDVNVSNGVKGAFSGSGKNYTLSITPSGDGAIGISVGQGSCLDGAGNGCNSANVTVTSDRASPVPTITGQSPTHVINNYEGTISFNEPVSGFTVDDLVVQGATYELHEVTPGLLYTFNLNISGASATVSIPAGCCTDLVGNPNIAKSFLVVIDTVRPFLNMTPVHAQTNQTTVNLTLNFSEAVHGLTVGDFIPINCTLGALVGADGNATYTLAVSPTNEGDFEIQLPVNACVDNAGLGNTAYDYTCRYDSASPSAILTPTGIITNSTPVTVTISFSEPVVNFISSDIVVINGTKGIFSQNDAKDVYTQVVYPSHDGLVTVSFPAGAGFDLAGNATQAASTSFTYDSTMPTVSISPDQTVSNASQIPFVFTFSETVTGFTASDIIVTNGTKGAFSGNGTTYNLTVSPSSDGAVVVTVPANAAIDTAGNGNQGSSATITSDRTPPELAITPNSGSNNASQIVFTFTFTEPVTGFSASKVSVTNGAKASFTGSGALYSLVVIPSGDGNVTVSCASGCAIDVANNEAIGATASVVSDRTPPTCTMTPNGVSRNSAAITMSLIFSEAITGLSLEDLQVENATIDQLSGNGASYSVIVHPIAEGVVNIRINSGTVIDSADNANLASSTSITYDITAPTCTITPNGTSTNSNSISFVFAFSEAVTGLTANGITVTNGTKGSFSGSGSSYTLVVSPTADGAVVVTLPAATVVDAAGNGNLAANATVTSDRTPPSIAITPNGSSTADNPILFTFTFGEAVTGFTVSDISVTNGTKGSFSTISASQYTLEVIPSSDNTVTISIATNVCTDLVGNPNPAASASVSSDRSGPTCTITPDQTSSNAQTILFSFAFSEPVTGFAIGDIQVANGVKGTFSGSGANYTLQVSPISDGTVSVNVASGVCQDLQSNPNGASTASVISDRTNPTCAISPSGITTSTSPINFTLTFSELVVGFTATDITVTNGIKGTFNGNGTTFTLQVTPSSDGQVTVAIQAGVCDDQAGNSNLSASATVISDRSPPNPTITPNSGSTNSNPIPFSFTFNKTVTDFTVDDITVTNGTASTFIGSGTSYTLLVIPNASGNTVTVAVPAGNVHDDLGNPNQLRTASVMFDSTAPTVTITPRDVIITTSPITFTFAFSEAVTGFNADDITVTNGAKGVFSGSGTTYSLLVSPATDGTVTVTVGAGSCFDQATNGNVQNSASIISDRTPPSLTITPNNSATNSSPVPVLFLFSEAVTGFTEDDVQVSGGTKSELIQVNPSRYTMNITPAADGDIAITVPANACVDQVSNPLALSQATFTSDRTRPTLSISPTGTTTPASPILFTITSSENITGLTAADCMVTNGTKGAFTAVSALEYSLEVTPIIDGAVSISIGDSSANDSAGNGNVAALAVATSDRTGPFPSITPNSGTITTSPIIFNIVFNEAVTGFTSADIMIQGAQLTNFSGNDASYTVSVTPDGEGSVTMTVLSSTCTDVYGNLNASSSASVHYDIPSAPVLTFSTGSLTIQRGDNPVPVDAGLIISDQDNPANLDNGFLKAQVTSNGDSLDVLRIATGTFNEWRVSVVGQTVRVQPADAPAGSAWTTVGLWSGGQSQTALTVTFNGESTLPRVIAVARSISFSSGTQVGSRQSVTKSLTMTINDGSSLGSSAVQSKTVTVAGGNIPPTTSPGSVSGLEDQNITGSLANLWQDVDSPASSISYAIGTVNHGQISSFDPVTGAFTFIPEPNYVGQAGFTFTVSDEATTSASSNMAITLSPVNDVPTYTPGSNVTVLEDAGVQALANWATGMSVGPANEVAQTLTFVVANNNTALFAVQPSVSANGTLTFTSATHRWGTATVSISLKDNGGVVNGGVDQTAVSTFTITVSKVDYPDVMSTIDLRTVLGVKATGRLTITNPNGDVDATGYAYSLTGVCHYGDLNVISNTGEVHFTPNRAGEEQITVRAISPLGQTVNGIIRIHGVDLANTNRPRISSTVPNGTVATGTAWVGEIAIAPDTVTAGADLQVLIQSPDARRLAGTSSAKLSGNSFQIRITPDVAYGTIQTFTIIVYDATTNASDVQRVVLEVTGGTPSPVGSTVGNG